MKRHVLLGGLCRTGYTVRITCSLLLLAAAVQWYSIRLSLRGCAPTRSGDSEHTLVLQAVVFRPLTTHSRENGTGVYVEVAHLESPLCTLIVSKSWSNRGRGGTCTSHCIISMYSGVVVIMQRFNNGNWACLHYLRIVVGKRRVGYGK